MIRRVLLLGGLPLLLGATSPLVEPAPGPGLDLLSAVAETLRRQPDILMAGESVGAAQGGLRAVRGRFDTQLQAALSQRGETTPIAPSAVQQTQLVSDQISAAKGQPTRDVPRSGTSYTTAYQVGVTQALRYGTVLQPSVQVSRVATSQTGLTPVPTVGQARVAFSVVQPLLRGRGRETGAAALEAASELQLRAAELQLRHTAATAVAQVAASYWAFIAAYRTVRIFLDAEERAEVLLRDEESLVRAGEHSASELRKLQANLADARAARIQSERQVIEARNALGLAMGLGWSEIEQLPPPVDDFPSAPRDALPQAQELAALVRVSLGQRADYLAAEAAARQAGVQVRAARRDLDPQVDLQLDLGYNGLTEGGGVAPFFTPPFQGVGGVNFFASLSLQYPLQNNAARGNLQQQEALRRRAHIALRDSERRVGAGVALAVQVLRAELQRLQSAETAVSAYREAVTSEQRRRRAGLSTIFDVLLIQGRLTSAELVLLQMRTNVATAITRLRYESGSLITPYGAALSVAADQLTTLPQREPEPPPGPPPSQEERS